MILLRSYVEPDGKLIMTPTHRGTIDGDATNIKFPTEPSFRPSNDVVRRCCTTTLFYEQKRRLVGWAS